MINEFLQNSIEDIFRAFPNLSDCIYSYDRYSDTHFIMIRSNSIYESELFARLDADISIKFYNLGQQGSLCFISPDSQISMANPRIFVNKTLPKAVTAVNGVLNYSIPDIFFSFPVVNQSFLVHNSIVKSFDSDNSNIYSLAA
jgi:hypothetical protein